MDFLFIRPGVTAFFISIILTPFLIKISRKKGLFASKDHRSSHEDAIPNTGGIILCFAVLIPLIIFSSYREQADFSFLLSAFAILLITGIIDDFNPLPVIFKFLGQFIPAIVIVLSIDEKDLIIPFIDHWINLPSLFNYLFWIIFIVMSINAFNLIDGIDGLAISLGIVGGLFYFFQFHGSGQFDLLVFSVSLIGGLAGLLFYNLSKKSKIFIGDTGSLLIGGLLVFFGLKFIGFSNGLTISNSFFLVLGTFFIPFADMIRVALVRIYNKKSPFQADRQHIHHLVLDFCKGNHFLATSIIVTSQVGVMLFFQAVTVQNNFYYFLATVFSIAFYMGFVFVIKRYFL